VTRRLSTLFVLAAALVAPLALADNPGPAPAQAPPPAPAPTAAPAPLPGFPPFQLPPFPWLPGAPAATPSSAPAAPAAQPAPTGLLPPILGALSWQSEVRVVLNELIASLSADKQARVQGIPLVFDPNPNTINAFAGCDEKGAPFMAGTEGLLEAIDAISQTVANDDLYGTRLYDQYTSAVIPRLVQSSSASPALPLGIVPFTTALDPRRLSHAHELFDNIVAFTFGHELSHHYLGHTGCASGQAALGGVDPAAILRIASRVPVFNQPLESAADSAGCVNVLDTGRARRPGFVWTERGGLLLLDFFSRMESTAGVSPLNPIGFLQTHPHPAIRIPVVQGVAQWWHQTHPG
jgi:hypothetical protein